MTKSVIFDLDNTLYNWVDAIVPAIREMVEKTSEITGISEEEIIRDLRKVNVSKGTIEHPYSMLEAECIRDFFAEQPEGSAEKVIDPAFHAFNVHRKTNLKLYEGTKKLFKYLRRRQFRILAFTEARIEATVDRLSRLELERFFDVIYCVRSVGFSDSDLHNDKFYSRIEPSKIRLLDSSVRKPNPEVLQQILDAEGLTPSETWYVGDSLIRDVGMAVSAGVNSAWAKYGTKHDPENMKFLVSITHWSDDEVKENIELSRQHQPKPDFVLDDSPLDLKANMAMFAATDRAANRSKHSVRS
ncbi:HAD family hydrolase [Hyphomonas sp. KY3]|uniref:HAD family hydrolase n=1 Tax=Hyphomonas sp. KY3 TaxID=2016196 RepID=UPI001A8F456D|nr:HAD family hydrolase [Hyphomonas sp. KY3]QSR20992.1 hypothetical protein CFA77_01645 [Hyphomonas sp. KY3]